MSKNSEIERYIQITTSSPDAVSKLNDDGMIIFGDFINTRIYRESNTLMPKEGIMVLEEENLVFYGSKSFIEKEYIIKFPYENISPAKSPAFTINFTYEISGRKVDKCKFSIAWEDYISRGIKSTFIKELKIKIKESIIKRARKLAKSKDGTKEAYFYYEKMFSNKIFDLVFLHNYIDLVKYEGKEQAGGHSNIYTGYLDKRRAKLIDIYPDQALLINSAMIVDKIKLETRSNIDYLNDINENYLYLDDKRIHIDEVLKTPKIRKIIENKTEEKIGEIKREILLQYREKLENYSQKMEIEKNIYREVISDNIHFINDLDLSKEKSDEILNNITDFYYRYKLLKDKLPDSFKIDRIKPKDGTNQLMFILENLSDKYLKIVDPYLYPSELDLLFDVHRDINIQIITYAYSTLQKEKQEQFQQKLDELRRSRFGRVSVRIIKFAKRKGTPLHDRAIFSRDWGLHLSNSLSQIGSKNDINVRRLFFSKDREVSEFDDFWYISTDFKKAGKIYKVDIIDL